MILVLFTVTLCCAVITATISCAKETIETQQKQKDIDTATDVLCKFCKEKANKQCTGSTYIVDCTPKLYLLREMKK